MRNDQKPSPRIYEGHGLDVHSIFYTIQGEGPYAGRPAVFVRLHGCNLQCPGCDTDYTSSNRHTQALQLANEVHRRYRANGKPLVVITGGEPLRQPINTFVNHLLDLGCTVQVETNGTLPLPDGLFIRGWQGVDFVCSPKTGSVNKMLARFIVAYKYVLSADSIHPDDGLPLKALGHPAQPMLARPPAAFPINKIYLQPMDPDPDGANLRACIASCYKFGYTLSLQQHKIIGVP